MWSPRELCVRMTCLRPSNTHHPRLSVQKEFMSTVALSSGLGALPARFRRERLLIVGCGDVGMRVALQLCAGRGCRPRAGDGPDLQPRTQGGSARGVCHAALGRPGPACHVAPPGRAGYAGVAPGPTAWRRGGRDAWWRDPRTLALARALRMRNLPISLAYASTSGVYGDCAGALVRETRPVAPATPSPSAVWMLKPLLTTWAAQGADQHSAHSGHLRA